MSSRPRFAKSGIGFSPAALVGAGERSGLKGDMQFSRVVTVRRGKVVLAEYFWDHQYALQAAGLGK